MILMYIFESYLDLRQHTAIKLPTLPKTLEGVISQEKFEKSRAYSIDKRYCHQHYPFNEYSLSNFWHTCLLMVFILHCLLSATSTSFMSLWVYWWRLQFCSLECCHGSGRWVFHFVKHWRSRGLPCLIYLLIAEIRRIFGAHWLQCWQWNTRHVCLFSRSYVLVTGEYYSSSSSLISFCYPRIYICNWLIMFVNLIGYCVS